MSNYKVQNQWGGSSAPWNPGGNWVIGGREKQNVVAMKVTSNDGGQTLTGSMTYNGEGPIAFRATLTSPNNYVVENQWGGPTAPWNPGGTFVLGSRQGQNVIALDLTSGNSGESLTGTMTYNGEGPIGFRGNMG
ncbi:hypothetical protein HUA76_28595 [Myxococcus sp. CA056]|nr:MULTISPECIES: hypothetical protein [unclassified Myxococcus]NTX14757.1 hypothetical protein [Myxococcus sp. CA056]NTX41479.1 hypothetical protein [Myxococcus sp. CA033]NTX56006.1 hypothetical protein [Myxococcus sp. CA039A]